jgi:polysaccharide biosynthesis/export protein
MMRVPFFRNAALTLLLVALAGCTSAASTGSSTAFVQQTGALPPPQVLAATPNAAAAEYRIGPLDLLEISVFQVPDLSKTVKVSASGEIAMPLIGTVQAGGKTVDELETEIKTKLEAKYLQSAQVSVFVKEATSQQVTVDGAVNQPGMVPLNGPTTLLQTIALSGGLAKNANSRGIVVFRTVDQKRMAAKFDLAAIRSGKAQDPVLYGGDIVVVDQSAFGSALSGIRESIPAFAVFTPLLL